jgi:transposase
MEPKKRSLGAGERDEFLRAAWRLFVAGKVNAERMVFVDEMGTNVSLSPLYGWSRRGERAFGSTPRNWGKNLTLLASITVVEGIGPCLAVEGATTRVVFEAYLERALAPSLRPGQVVVMDNLSAHKGGRVRIIESRGCELLYLPPYSPDLNPIEEAFSKVKGLMRRAEARTRAGLVEVMGRALDAVTARDARGFFEHRGYPTMAQPL